ncbi:MAG: hypothetical protein WCL18_02560 [bacterium]
MFFGTEIFDGFQSIFKIQIGAYIIAAIERNDIANIKFWCIVLGVVFLLSYIMGWLGEMTTEVANNLSHLGLRKKYFEKYIHLDNTKTEKI